MHVGVDKPETERLWKNHALRTLRHNRKIRQRLLATMKPAYIKSPGGIIAGKGTAFLWDSEAHDKIIERTIRGLYYFHFREILGDQVQCKVHWLRGIPKDVFEMSKQWKQHVLGNGHVVYRYGRPQDNPLCSIWLFQFYGKHWSSGYTVPNDYYHKALQPIELVSG